GLCLPRGYLMRAHMILMLTSLLSVLVGCYDIAETPTDAGQGTATDALDLVEAAADAEDAPDAATSGLCQAAGGEAVQPVEAEVNGWTVAVSAETGVWSIAPPGGASPVLEGAPTCVEGEGGWLSSTRAGVGAPRVKAS